MKKKFLLLIVVLLFGVINVHAAEVPKVVNYGDFSYSIEGIELDIYDVVDTDETTNSDETDNFLENYIYNRPQDTITLDMSEFTLNPVVKEEKIEDYNYYFIDLNIDLTEEKLVSLLSDQLNSVNENIGYYIAINVKYKILSYPRQYVKIQDYNILRTFFNLFSDDKVNDIIDPTKINEQTINIVGISYDKNAQAPRIDYEEDITEDNGLETMVANFHSYMAEGDGTGGVLENREVMFHNLDNQELLISKVRESIENNFNQNDYTDPITSTNNDTTQVVKVDNTAQNKPLQQLLLAVLSILIGSAAVFTVMVKKQLYKY